MQCEVYVLGQKVAALIGPKIDGEFEFDISRLLKAFLSFQYVNNPIGTYDCPEMVKPFYCVFTEKYNDSIGLQVDGATITSSVYKINMINLDYYSFNHSDYIVGLPFTSKFLTNSPKVQNIRSNEKKHLYFITNLTNIQINVETTYNDGSNDNDLYPVTVTNGAACFILEVTQPNSKRIDVWLENSDEENQSEVRSFNVIDNNCNGLLIEWINNVNGYDNFIFNGDKVVNNNTSKTEVKNLVPSDYDGSFHQNKVTSSITNQQINIFSKFVNEETANWLVELQNSKSVWHNDNGTRKAIKVVSSSIVSKNANNLLQVLLVFTYEAFENY